MLVLTRRPGQGLLIGDSIEVRVIRIVGDRVVLGVVAPREIAVVRDELAAEIAQETRAAAEAVSNVRDALRREG
jgi:carbon storage regulator